MAEQKRLWREHTKSKEQPGMELSPVAPETGDEISNVSVGRPIQPVVEETRPRILAEDAAYALIEYLPEDVQQLIREAKGSCGMPMWQVLLGYVMRCAEHGELFVPIQLQMWESGKKANEPRGCATCGQTFTSRHPNAQYCCARCYFGKLEEFGGHSDECLALIYQRSNVTAG